MTAWSVRRRGKETRAGASTRYFAIEQSLGYLVNRAARVMAQQLADELRPAGVGIGQWAVLMFLWSRDGLSQAELARVVAIEPPTMVRTIDRMVRDGLVERRADPADRRISRIFLTPKGQSLRDQLVPKAVEVNRRNLARMNESERRTLFRLLKRISQPVADQPGRNA